MDTGQSTYDSEESAERDIKGGKWSIVGFDARLVKRTITDQIVGEVVKA